MSERVVHCLLQEASRIREEQTYNSLTIINLIKKCYYYKAYYNSQTCAAAVHFLFSSQWK